MWHQRSKALWLKEGDQNSKFFHAKATRRRKRNNILKIQDDNGEWKNGNGRDQVILDFFKNLFSTSNQRGSMDFLGNLIGRVTNPMNEGLATRYTKQEVIEALRQIHPLKALGLDGMAPNFYQKLWPFVGGSVTAIVLQTLNTGEFPTSLNHTYITLIPKKKSPTKVAGFRPISLCNVVYKLMSKIIANRLKSVLPCIILES